MLQGDCNKDTIHFTLVPSRDGTPLTRVFHFRLQECSDERLRMCNELLQGIKSLKLYSWERLFCDAVERVRRRQIFLLLKGSCIAAITSE